MHKWLTLGNLLALGREHFGTVGHLIPFEFPALAIVDGNLAVAFQDDQFHFPIVRVGDFGDVQIMVGHHTLLAGQNLVFQYAV